MTDPNQTDAPLHTRPASASSVRAPTRVYTVLVPLLILIAVGVFAVRSQTTRKEPMPVPTPAAVTAPQDTPAAGPGNVALALDPAAVSIAPGTSQEIRLTMDTGDATVSAAEIHITFDPEIISVTGFTPANTLPSVLEPYRARDGTFSVTLGVVPSKPFTGMDTVGTLTVTGVSEGTTEMHYSADTQIAALYRRTNAMGSTAGATIAVTTAP